MRSKLVMLLIVSVVVFSAFAMLAVSKDSSGLRRRPYYTWSSPLYEPTYKEPLIRPENVYYAKYGQVCGLISDDPAVNVVCIGGYKCEKFTPKVGFCGVKKDLWTKYTQFY